MPIIIWTKSIKFVHNIAGPVLALFLRLVSGKARNKYEEALSKAFREIALMWLSQLDLIKGIDPETA